MVLFEVRERGEGRVANLELVRKKLLWLLEVFFRPTPAELGPDFCCTGHTDAGLMGTGLKQDTPWWMYLKPPRV